jgi:hypothetical protein
MTAPENPWKLGPTDAPLPRLLTRTGAYWEVVAGAF